jgi:hypothetical protein
MSQFLNGAVTTASFAIGLFFLRYWRTTGDRLFVMFSAAFWLLALHWMLASAFPDWTTQAHVLRFLAFVLIAVAVLDKNRHPERQRRSAKP